MVGLSYVNLFFGRILTSYIQDFDRGLVGQTVVQGLTSPAGLSQVTWTVVNASEFPEGPSQVRHALIQQRTWVAVISTLLFLFYTLLQ